MTLWNQELQTFSMLKIAVRALLYCAGELNPPTLQYQCQQE